MGVVKNFTRATRAITHIEPSPNLQYLPMPMTQTHTHTHTHTAGYYIPPIVNLYPSLQLTFIRVLKDYCQTSLPETCHVSLHILGVIEIWDKSKISHTFCPRKCVGNIIIEQCSGNLPEILLYNINLIVVFSHLYHVLHKTTGLFPIVMHTNRCTFPRNV